MAKLVECNKGDQCDYTHIQLGEGNPHTDPSVTVVSVTHDEYAELAHFFFFEAE